MTAERDAAGRFKTPGDWLGAAMRSRLGPSGAGVMQPAAPAAPADAPAAADPPAEGTGFGGGPVAAIPAGRSLNDEMRRRAGL